MVAIAPLYGCPFCGKSVIPREATVCPQCDTPHHPSCWDRLGGCAIFACDRHVWHATRAPGVLEGCFEQLSYWRRIVRMQWWMGVIRDFSFLALTFGLLIVLPGIPFLDPHALGLVIAVGAPYCLVAFVVGAVAAMARIFLRAPALAVRKVIEADLLADLAAMGSPGSIEFPDDGASETDLPSHLVRIAAIILGTVAMGTALWFIPNVSTSTDVIYGIGAAIAYFSWYLPRRALREAVNTRIWFATVATRLRASWRLHGARPADEGLLEVGQTAAAETCANAEQASARVPTSKRPHDDGASTGVPRAGDSTGAIGTGVTTDAIGTGVTAGSPGAAATVERFHAGGAAVSPDDATDGLVSPHGHDLHGRVEEAALTVRDDFLLAPGSRRPTDPRGRCPVCSCTVNEREALVSCPRCATRHHRECWDYAGGCAMFGCSRRGWQGAFDPELFGRVSTLADEWVNLFQRQWLLFGCAVGGAFLAALGHILPTGAVATVVFGFGLVLCGLGLAGYALSLPGTYLQQRSLQQLLSVSLEPPQGQARAVVERVRAPALEETVSILVRVIALVSLALTIIIPILASTVPDLWGRSVTLLDMVALIVAGVALPYGGALASERRSMHIQSIRNRLLASFNVYRKLPDQGPDKPTKQLPGGN